MDAGLVDHDDSPDGTHLNAISTAQAVVAYDSPLSFLPDIINEARINADAAARAVFRHLYADAGHALYLGRYTPVDIGSEAPQATAGTAIADGQQLFPRAHPQPDCVQLILTHQVI